jgi:hypothetical protein
MQGRLRALRFRFGLSRSAMAALLGVTPAQWQCWEESEEHLTEPRWRSLAQQIGVNPAWLSEVESPLCDERIQEMQVWLGEEVRGLGGPRSMALTRATTGERIAYAVRLASSRLPDVLRPDSLAAWLGLSATSLSLMLRGDLDPGTPVVERAADLTGIPSRWFREGLVHSLDEG